MTAGIGQRDNMSKVSKSSAWSGEARRSVNINDRKREEDSQKASQHITLQEERVYEGEKVIV